MDMAVVLVLVLAGGGGAGKWAHKSEKDLQKDFRSISR